MKIPFIKKLTVNRGICFRAIKTGECQLLHNDNSELRIERAFYDGYKPCDECRLQLEHELSSAISKAYWKIAGALKYSWETRIYFIIMIVWPGITLGLSIHSFLREFFY